MKTSRPRHFAGKAHGAALVEHGTLLGLVALVGLGAAIGLGRTVSDGFSVASNALGVAQEEAQASTSGDDLAELGEGEDGGDRGDGGDPVDPTRPTVPTVVASNTFDANSGVHYAATRSSPFIDPSPFGYTGSNNSVHHFNSVQLSTSGVSWVEVGSEQIGWPGVYDVDIMVGNFNNKPFLQGFDVGLKSGGAYLTPVSSITPTPALGKAILWTLSYDVTQAQIDAGIIFEINVPTTGANLNGSFDDLSITFRP